MNTKKTISGLIYLLVLSLASCNDEEFRPSSGSADFREYLAVGNSLTAAYADGGLYRAAQINSYPAILARQLSLNSGLAFSQPLMPEGNGSGYIELLAYPDNGIPVIQYLSADPRAFDKVGGPFHNLGVPGIRVKDLDMKNYGARDNNRYMYRLLPTGTENNTSYLDLVGESNHSFFTCWMDNNDVLGYAMDGGAYGIEGRGTYGESGLTPVAEFDAKFQQLADALTKDNALGILINIPDILETPYFNLVSNADFPDFSSNVIKELNGVYADINEKVALYNQQIENDESLTEAEKNALYRETISFSVSGNNAFVIEDKDLPNIDMTDSQGKPIPKIRHLKDGEKITIPGIFEISDLSALAGIYKPLDDEYVLTFAEMELIDEYRQAFNTIIEETAVSRNIPLLDIDKLMKEYKAGKTIDGVFVSTDIVEGGLFSLDGVHLTQRGYAMVANEIIAQINQAYGAEIPRVNISTYKGLDIPE